VRLFQILRTNGERFDPTEVRAWAVNNRWSGSGARELEEIARGVLEGRRFRVERFGWRDDVIDLWRSQAASGNTES
jgi:hypothetical protein